MMVRKDLRITISWTGLNEKLDLNKAVEVWLRVWVLAKAQEWGAHLREHCVADPSPGRGTRR